MKLFGPILMILASIALFFFYIQPVYKSTTKDTSVYSLMQQQELYVTALANAKNVLALRDSFLNTYKNFSQTDIERLTVMMPDHVNSTRFLVDINTIATRYGLLTEDVSIDDGSTKTRSVPGRGAKQEEESALPYKSITYTFTVSASYDSFNTFITDLENSLQIADITSIQVKAGDAKQSLYDFNVTLKTYELNYNK